MRMKGKMEWWNGGRLRASSQHPNTPAPHLRNGFTLIELLAVVAIMSIILIAAIPMFQTMGKRDLGPAAAQLRATLRLARQYAVTQRQAVYVIFPVNNDEASVDDVDKLLRAYAVVATNAMTRSYEYITDWKYLPQGVYFIDDPMAFSGQVLRELAPEMPFPDTSDPLSTRDVAGIRFLPTGMAGRWFNNAWTKEEVTLGLTTSRFYTKNPDNTQLVRGADIPGVTNLVRVRRYSGQVTIRDGQN